MLFPILWQSNGPNTPTGYGNQTNLSKRALKQAGYDIKIFAFYGVEGNAQIDSDGVQTFPRLIDGWGNDVIEGHMTFTEAKLLITLMDPFVLNPDIYGKFPWCAWVPVDSAPPLPANVNTLKSAKWIWAMSRFGEAELHRAGFKNVVYVPHGVDTEVYKPVDRAKVRERLGGYWKRDLKDTFLIVMNAANKGMPSRKGFSQALEAFKLFSDKHPDSLLYLHTEVNGIFVGENLPTTIAALGIDPQKVLFPPQYQFLMGMMGTDYLNEVYNAADTYLNTSAGGGFELPVVEAQAAGCPVIVTNFSAMPELVFAGSKVDGRKVMIIPGTFQMLPDIENLVHELEVHYNLRGDLVMREQARAGALDYDYRKVFGQYMEPALRQIQTELAASAMPGHVHDWATTGLFDEQGDMCVPCRHAECEAELRIARTNGSRTIIPYQFGTTINGVKLKIEDDPRGGVAKIVCREAERNYRLDEIEFVAGSVAVDIGAHVGIVSIYLAKKHPEITIYAYEPVKANYERLLRNIEANGVKNIKAFNLAVTGDGREVTLYGNLGGNSGGSSMIAGSKVMEVVPSTTLRGIFEQFPGKNASLLKIDCEGAEYEILTSDESLLSKVQALRGEFHQNNILQGAEQLMEMCRKHIPNLWVGICVIADSQEAMFEEARRKRTEREASNG